MSRQVPVTVPALSDFFVAADLGTVFPIDDTVLSAIKRLKKKLGPLSFTGSYISGYPRLVIEQMVLNFVLIVPFFYLWQPDAPRHHSTDSSDSDVRSILRERTRPSEQSCPRINRQ